MSDTTRCTGCGTNLRGADGKCPQCGAAVPSAASGPSAARGERIRRVRADPSFEGAPAPGLSNPTARLCGGVVMGLLFSAVAAVMLTIVLGKSGTKAFAFVPGVFIAIGLLVVVISVVRLARFLLAPQQRLAAAIVSKRMHLRRRRRGRTYYYVTLEFEGGERREYEAGGSMYGLVAEDDAGVAYVRHVYLTGFRRVDV